ncbi:MAG: hypothetical protein J6W30_03200 [Bacteroidales bacterium]|nr:hypothetical protein [Bacteroidales bacterium]
MKKITLILMAAFLVVTVGSCTKDETPNNNNNNGNENTFNDGVYTPQKKITRTYYWSDYEYAKVPQEVWYWNGGTLETIDHVYSDGSIDWTEIISYSGDRIVRVDHSDSGYGRYMRYNYDDNRLSLATLYRHNKKREELRFSYGANGKVNQITMTYFYDGKGLMDSPEESTLLASLLPKKLLARLEDNRGTREGSETITIQLAWSGENISKVIASGEYYEEDFVEEFREEYTLTFDNKTNPKKGFLGLNTFYEGFDGFISYYCKNNIKRIVYSYSETEYEYGVVEDEDTGSGEYDYEYEYDNAGFPLRIESIHTYDGGDTNTYITYYEYQ